jgi:hypothetical protein
MTTIHLPDTLLETYPNKEIAENTLQQLKGGDFTAINHHVYSTMVNGEKLFIKIYYNSQRSKEVKRKLGLLEHEAFVEYEAFLK